MPGYEIVGKEELLEIQEIFTDGGGVFFRFGFDAIRNGIYKVKTFESKFAEHFGTKHALAVSSGTAALKIALKGLGIKHGDEVITQAFTFVATVEAIIEAGATPKVTDIDSFLNMAPDSLEQLITSKTKAIIVVHMLGVPCNLSLILPIAKKYGIPVIEDTAWGCGGKYSNDYLGTIGDIGTFSFDNAKAMTTGEGGMIVTKNDALDHKMRAYHDHGHDNNPAVPRWVDTRSSSGFNYRMTELQGAVGLAQLKKLPFVISEQQRIHRALTDVIASIPGVTERPNPINSKATCDAYVFDAGTKETALICREKLQENGFGTKILPEAITWHFAGCWDHMPELLNSYHGRLADTFSKSEELLRRHVAVPINLSYQPATIKKIGDTIRSVFKI